MTYFDQICPGQTNPTEYDSKKLDFYKYLYLHGNGGENERPSISIV